MNALSITAACLLQKVSLAEFLGLRIYTYNLLTSSVTGAPLPALVIGPRVALEDAAAVGGLGRETGGLGLETGRLGLAKGGNASRATAAAATAGDGSAGRAGGRAGGAWLVVAATGCAAGPAAVEGGGALAAYAGSVNCPPNVLWVVDWALCTANVL